jgi:predicted outer membrane repeat protein
MRLTSRFWWLATLLALVSACGRSPLGVDAPPCEAGADDGEDSDPPGFVCVGDRCYRVCETDDDCPDPQQQCIDGLCLSGPVTCGDGGVDGLEACDDGNLDWGDGCDALCRVEAGWVCTGEPSTCRCQPGLQDHDGDGRCRPGCSLIDCVYGVCDDASGVAECHCDAGYAGPACDRCAAGYVWRGGVCRPGCDLIPCVHGICDDSSGSAWCECDEGYSGSDCSECSYDYQDHDGDGVCRPACSAAVECNHGRCNDASGTAVCQCDPGYAGDACAECDADYQDHDGDGICWPSCALCEHGVCDDSDGVAECVQCETGYTGPYCAECDADYQDHDGDGTCLPRCGTADFDCWGHGDCDDSSGEARCDCDPYYGGNNCHACVVYTTTAATGDGSSWSDPLDSIHDALERAAALAEERGGVCDVWATFGRYSIRAYGPDASFVLAENVRLYGGFAGTETDLTDRRWWEHETILDGAGWGEPQSRVNHVVMASSRSVLDGVVVENGRADGDSEAGSEAASLGGGFYADSVTDVVIENCTFRSNDAVDRGGAVFVTGPSSLTISNTVFHRNSAVGGGGAIALDDAAVAAVDDCVFDRNEAARGAGLFVWGVYPSGTTTVQDSLFLRNQALDDGGQGGGIYVHRAYVSIADSAFVRNEADDGGGAIAAGYLTEVRVSGCQFGANGARKGGAMFNDGGCSNTVSASAFFSNHAEASGGAIWDGSGSDTQVVNSLFVANQAASQGGAFHGWASSPSIRGSTVVGNEAPSEGILGQSGFPVISSCILWGNEPNEIVDAGDDTLITVAYCDADGGEAICDTCAFGPGLIEDDPRFAPAPEPSSGTWEALAYAEEQYQTTFRDEAADWTPGALQGLFVQPDDRRPEQFLITANTHRSLSVAGDVTPLVLDGSAYRLFDYHLSSDSPCIDAGSLDDADLASDFEGAERDEHPDIGAFEFQP